MFNRGDQLVLAHIVPGRPLVVTLLLSLVVMLVPSLVKWGDRLMVRAAVICWWMVPAWSGLAS